MVRSPGIRTRGGAVRDGASQPAPSGAQQCPEVRAMGSAVTTLAPPRPLLSDRFLWSGGPSLSQAPQEWEVTFGVFECPHFRRVMEWGSWPGDPFLPQAPGPCVSPPGSCSSAAHWGDGNSKRQQVHATPRSEGRRGLRQRESRGCTATPPERRLCRGPGHSDASGSREVQADSERPQGPQERHGAVRTGGPDPWGGGAGPTGAGVPDGG